MIFGAFSTATKEIFQKAIVWMPGSLSEALRACFLSHYYINCLYVY